MPVHVSTVPNPIELATAIERTREIPLRTVNSSFFPMHYFGHALVISSQTYGFVTTSPKIPKVSPGAYP